MACGGWIGIDNDGEVLRVVEGSHSGKGVFTHLFIGGEGYVMEVII